MSLQTLIHIFWERRGVCATLNKKNTLFHQKGNPFCSWMTCPQHISTIHKKRTSALSAETRVYAHNHCLATAAATVSKSGDVGLLLPNIQSETKPEFISQLPRSQRCRQRQSQKVRGHRISGGRGLAFTFPLRLRYHNYRNVTYSSV